MKNQAVRQPEWGGSVAVGVGYAFDEPVEAEAAQVVGHAPGGELVEGRAAGAARGAVVGRGWRTRLAGGRRDGDGGEEGVDAGVAETQSGDTLAVDDGGLGDLVEDGVADDRVVADRLGVK